MYKEILAFILVCVGISFPLANLAAAEPPATTQVPPTIPIPSDNAKALDEEIKQFKDARDQAESQAYDEGSNADQYLGQNWVDYQQAIRKQEMYQQQVKDLDEKIKELEKQRAAIK